ncbi:hypothetical protein WDW37_17070 [Bdellovibrionota bacterium FG-1]
MFKFDKEKYLQLARTEGAHIALTRLARDTERWEWDTFEGEGGWKPNQFEVLGEVRAFSREIWEAATNRSV